MKRTTTAHPQNRKAPTGGPATNGTPRTATPGVAPPGGRVRLPELAVGMFVTVACALAAVLWHLNATDRVPALAIATSVERGATIGPEDLTVVYVDSDHALARLDDGQASSVVGRVALVDLPAGMLVTSAVVADEAALEPGDGVVGLALEPGGYPSMRLAVGDLVDVVQVGDPTAAAGVVDDLVVARAATVVGIEELSSDRRLVSILTSETDARAVAAVSGTGSLRLVVVSK